MNKFEINGKEYTAKAFGFNLMCDLEDMGVPMQRAGEKNFKFMRSYFSLCSGLSEEEAGQEMEMHIINGGTFEKLSDALSDEMDKSDFFRALMEGQESKNPESEEKTAKEK